MMLLPRYSMTVISNITVFLVAWAFFGMSGNDHLSEADVGSFRNIMLVVLGIGILATVLFHCVVEEKPRDDLIPSSYDEIDGEVTRRDFVQPMGIKDSANLVRVPSALDTISFDKFRRDHRR